MSTTIMCHRPMANLFWSLGMCCVALCGVINGAYGQDIKRIAINTNDVIYVPGEDRIYATTKSGQPNGNRLCVINPYWGSIDTCYYVGENPGVLALSDDGTQLYIGLNTAPQVLVFNMHTKQTEGILNLVSDFLSNNTRAGQIRSLPGSPGSVVISRVSQTFNPGYSGLLVFDGIVRRPNVPYPYQGEIDVFDFTDSGRMFGATVRSSGFELYEVNIGPEGPTIGASYEDFIANFPNDIKAEGELLYTSNGRVIDVSGSQPDLAGTFEVSTGARGGVPSPDSNLVYFVTSGPSNSCIFERHNKTTFNRISSQVIPDVTGYLQNLILLGGDGKLAFWTDKMLVIIRHCESLITSPVVLPSYTAGGCSGTNVELSAPPGNNAYFWSTGSTGNSTLVNQPGQYFLWAADSLGCLGPPSEPITVTMSFPPVSSPSIAGNSQIQICRGGSATLSVFGGSGLYSWSNGATGSSIQVSEPGQYRVRRVSSAGCPGTYSNPVTVSFLPDSLPPRPSITMLSDTVLCQGNSFSLLAPAGYQLYRWTLGDNTFTRTTPTFIPNFIGTYTLRVSNTDQCISEPSLPVNLTLLARPVRPSVMTNGNLLASTATEGNQWFLNGQPIPGATGQFHTAAARGQYSVQVTGSNGCVSQMSLLYHHFNAPAGEIAIDRPAPLAYPNPATDELNIHWSTLEDIVTEVLVFDVSGARVATLPCAFFGGSGLLNIANLSSGIYWISVKDAKGIPVSVGKIMKR
ncbi:MAG: T9SS type A sorting domain-containing protein [Saprospiraceae bacterium]|nr:T9SS type A sorting domain-containing protein [Saprospiraceae bacterium]